MIQAMTSLSASNAQLSGLRKLISKNISASFGLMSSGAGASGGNGLNAPPLSVGTGLSFNVQA